MSKLNARTRHIKRLRRLNYHRAMVKLKRLDSIQFCDLFILRQQSCPLQLHLIPSRLKLVPGLKLLNNCSKSADGELWTFNDHGIWNSAQLLKHGVYIILAPCAFQNDGRGTERIIIVYSTGRLLWRTSPTILLRSGVRGFTALVRAERGTGFLYFFREVFVPSSSAAGGRSAGVGLTVFVFFVIGGCSTTIQSLSS